jgi:catalase
VGIATRRIALLVADGVNGKAMNALHRELLQQGAVPRFVGPRLGAVKTADGDDIDVEVTLEAAPAVLFDAMVAPDGSAADALASIGHAVEFVKDQYRHCKPILALGAGRKLLEAAKIPPELPDGGADPGILLGDKPATRDFVTAIAKHRHFERQTDPPRI